MKEKTAVYVLQESVLMVVVAQIHYREFKSR